MVSGAPEIFDQALIVRRRNRALAVAGVPDFLIARVAQDFEDRLQAVQRKFATAINFDAYNGVVSRRLRSLPSVGLMIDVEPSVAALTACGPKVPRVGAHAEALPFSDSSLDLAVSALSLQFANDLPGALLQVRRALKADGLLLAALLGGETLHELREAWLLAESEVLGGASPRVAPFADLRELGGLMQRAGYSLIVADSERVTVRYASPLALMRELKAMGASNALAQRSRQPVSRRLLLRAAEIYSDRFAGRDGRVPATFEIVTLTGWVPHPSQPKPLAPGSASVSLADVLKPSSGDPEAKE